MIMLGKWLDGEKDIWIKRERNYGKNRKGRNDEGERKEGKINR